MTATSTQPPAFAATPTRVALPARTPTGQPVGPLAVYSTEPGPGRASGLRELRAFDTGSGEEWAGFTFGGPDDPSRDEALGPGRLVVYATAKRVSARSLEGGPARLLYEAPNGVSVTNISVSHSRTLVAVATFFKDSGGNSLSDLFFLDLGPAGPAPSPASRVPIHSTDPQLAGGFSGYFAAPQWLVDDAGVMVVGARQRGGDPARATLFTNGRIQVHEPGRRETSPDGRYAFISRWSPCEDPVNGPLRVVDALTGQEVVWIRPDRGGVFAQEWLPDSSGVLFSQWEEPGPGCGDDPTLKHWLQPVSGLAPTPVVDVDALRHQVYRPHMFELGCPEGRAHPIAPPTGGYLSCDSTETYGPLTIGGQPAGTGGVIRTLGVIP